MNKTLTSAELETLSLELAALSADRQAEADEARTRVLEMEIEDGKDALELALAVDRLRAARYAAALTRRTSLPGRFADWWDNLDI